jgi:hypothetical protein
VDAVFISYVMRTAGAGSAFAYSAAHQTYAKTFPRERPLVLLGA